MSQLVRLRGTQTAQTAHCALLQQDIDFYEDDYYFDDLDDDHDVVVVVVDDDDYNDNDDDRGLIVYPQAV